MTSHEITLSVNGEPLRAEVADDETLLAVLRRFSQLYGSRESCGQGLCGTCTIVLDGRAISSCLMPARLVNGSAVETVEGMGTPGRLSEVQEAFIQEWGFQCGFCTPGMVVMATQLLRENPDPTDDEIRHYLAGNICRCGAYPEIVQAVRAAAERRRAAAAA
jgi:aerobic-type carbon monoxide dehydrogenase small subunit (CoxS/CutS family)